MATYLLDMCRPERDEVEGFVRRHFSGLVTTPDQHDDRHDAVTMSSSAFRGGQSHADKALATLDLNGYTRNRTQAYPEPRRGAARLSPYIRHGLLDLPRVWSDVDGPEVEVERFRLELLWQEYARHLYARVGSAMKEPLLFPAPESASSRRSRTAEWNQDMGCIEITTGELEDDGWLVGQARLWLASHWTVREGGDWREGENYFFRHLLDGSRAANLLGWQTAMGTATGRPYNFTRWQVESRAAGLCATCELNTSCPIDRWPDTHGRAGSPLDRPLLASDPDLQSTAGPNHLDDSSDRAAEVIWMTAESMGDADPALRAKPDLPVVFVFDRPLLEKLQLSTKRLVFMVETLAELATKRDVEVYLGSPSQALSGRRVATTFAPVPGWKRHAAKVNPVEVHPWRWLRHPGVGDISSFAHWLDQTVNGRGLPSAVPVVDSAPTAVSLQSSVRAIPVAANMRYSKT